MQPIPFAPRTDLAPIVFDGRQLLLAKEMKKEGLPWQPHVGCFVWDEQRVIQPASPFPNDVYFILSLPRFIDIFGSLEKIQEQLIWIPTWHQARLLARNLGISDDTVAALWQTDPPMAPGEEEYRLYELLLENLRSTGPIEKV